jgi:hypothetical protein
MADRKYEKYIIHSDSKFPSSKRIRYDGSGSVDLSLRGLYTNNTEAMQAIDNFNRKKEGAAKNADETKPARRDKVVHKGADNGSEPATVPA